MKFFIDARDGIADYAKTYFPRETGEVIAIANDVVNQKFLFNLRWDMERTYVPVVFEGEIDWMHQPGDDPEWIFAFNRMRFWICLGQAYAITKDETYAQTFAAQLCHWIDTVKKNDPKCEKAWRSIEAGIRMEYWCKAFSYFNGSPAITDAVTEKYRASLTEHAEFIMGVWNSYNLMSNWGVLANHGLFVASIALPQTARTEEFREEALRRLAKEIEIQVYADGTQWEQSPMYHNEVAHDFLDVIILARKNNIAIPEIIERKTRDMCYANLWWCKPDGNELCMGDSDEIDARDITTKGAFLFRDGTLKAGGYERLDFDCVWDLGYVAIAEYNALESKPIGDTMHILGDSGNFYLRSSWESDATFLHFHCGTLGAGHGHGDQLHIDLFAHGEDILIDPGRFTYVAKTERFEFKDSSAHNTCTVDGKNFYECKDSWECSKLSRAVNRSSAQKKNYALFEGGHLGYYDLSSGGVFANRRIISIDCSLFVIVDEFYASGAHDYQCHLHFNNRGKVSQEKKSIRYISDLNDVHIEQLSSGPIRTELDKSRISRHYNLAEKTTAVCTSISGTGFVSLYTVISLDGHVAVTKNPVTSNFKSTVFDHKMIESLTVSRKGGTHTLVIAHQEYASPTDTFCADGCTGFGSVVVFDRTKNETEIGTVLQW